MCIVVSSCQKPQPAVPRDVTIKVSVLNVTPGQPNPDVKIEIKGAAAPQAGPTDSNGNVAFVFPKVRPEEMEIVASAQSQFRHSIPVQGGFQTGSSGTGRRKLTSGENFIDLTIPLQPIVNASDIQPSANSEPGGSMSPLSGSSLSHGQEQNIVLLSVTEVRNLPDALWFAGKGYAIVNGGSGAYFWHSSTPPQLEIEIRSSDPFLPQCEKLVKRGIEGGKTLSIRGAGSFKGMEVARVFLGAFSLDSLSKCEIADKT